jgi:hypothetical protein
LKSDRRPARSPRRPEADDPIADHSHPLIDYGTGRLEEAKAGDAALREVLEGPSAGEVREAREKT